MKKSEITTDADVCIIGAGAAGGIIAWKLGLQGMKVVVLESGPRHPFSRRYEYAQRFIKGENPWQTGPAGIDSYSTAGSTPYDLERNRARGVGGSTLHWEGYALRFRADDLRLRSLYGIADDWPISYEEMEEYYCEAEKELGVAGIADDPWASHRSRSFPIPPFAHSFSDGFFARGCKATDITMHHLPQARNSIPYGGRAQCRGCGTCHVCPTGAKASTDLTHIPKAEATGNVQVLTDVNALRLETDGFNRISAVIYARHDRVERRLPARVFIIAAGAVETPRLLLLSASREFPDGLANRSNLVGKYFMSHPSMDITGRAMKKVYPYRVGFSTAMTSRFSAERNRSRNGAFFFEFLNSAGLTPAGIALSSGKWGEDLQRHVREEFGRTLGIRVYCEQLPDKENSVSLDPDKRDYFGSPVPLITYNVGDYEREALKEAHGIAGRILEAAGASRIRSSELRYAAHQIGTHRMGRDPGRSVVDENLRAHDHPNLYLAGSGCFVTATPSPPTLTIAALAIRLSSHLASLRGSGTAG